MPRFQDLFTNVLDVLADGKPRARRDVAELVVTGLDLTPEERVEKLSGGGNRAESRVHWAVQHLAQAAAIERPTRGHLQITDLGRAMLANNPDGVTLKVVTATPGAQAWYERSRAMQTAKKNGDHVADLAEPDESGQTPEEQMVSLWEAMRNDVEAAVLERLRTGHWEFMERAVLQVLHAMGYGETQDDLQHVGGSHDGGVDGIINQDKLGLDRIYVQSKRYKEGSAIGRHDVSSFIGSMDTNGITKGVFITASHFTPEAQQEVRRNMSRQIILIDGPKLVGIMLQHRLGVTMERTYPIYAIDENFFADD